MVLVGEICLAPVVEVQEGDVVRMRAAIVGDNLAVRAKRDARSFAQCLSCIWSTLAAPIARL